jgi:predicted phage terminase large subunit-like protein
LAAEFNPDEVLVENAASGQSLIQELRTDTVLPVKPVQVDSAKFSRASAVTPMFESGRVFFPEAAGWLSPLTWSF